MGRSNVFDNHLLLFQRVVQRNGAKWTLVLPGFDALTNDRLGGAAIMRLQFETIKHGRIVTGGNHYAADGAQGFDGKRDGRRRRRHGSQRDLEAVTGEDLRRPGRELVREKSPIVTDHGPLLRSLNGRGIPIIRRGLGHAFHVLERKILGDDRPPAVGSKPDLPHDFNSGFAPVRPRSSAFCAAPP